jgi:glycosyltransferase involved in cell wall biosynthesis
VKVAFDSRPAADPRGIGRYTRSLLAALREEAAERGGEIVEANRHRGADCFHTPWIDGALLRPRAPVVVTLHDLVPLKRRGEYLRSGLRFRMRYLAVERSTRLIVPTHAVAADAVELLHVTGDRIDVIAEAAAPAFHPRPDAEVAAVRARHDLPDEYLVWVGGLRHPDPRKRVAAMSETPRRLPLVLVGDPGQWARELDDVILTGAVSDDDLAAIYTGAHALVFPSDDEGFGLPTVEALACGTPVVACDVPALREVLGDRATFVDCDDLVALLEAAEAAQRPAPAPPEWTWADAARATWDSYERACEQSAGGSSSTARALRRENL